jgi:hypothetical protein
MTTAKNIRSQLIDALRLDLVGPRPSHAAHATYADEVLPLSPSKWYLTGFLVPHEAPLGQRADHDSDDKLDEVNKAREADDDAAPEPASARKALFPSSMGLSVLVSHDTAQLRVKVAWADYLPLGRSTGEVHDEEDFQLTNPPAEPAGRNNWKRVPREAERTVTLAEGIHTPVSLPGHENLHLVISVRAIVDSRLVPKGTRSVSVFLVNHRTPSPDVIRDASYIFQPELSLRALQPFVARPSLHHQNSNDWDEKIADLQFRDVVEYAVGHNISALATTDDDGKHREVRSAWMPIADVEKVIPRKIENVELSMEALASAPNAETIRTMVSPMLKAYAVWLRKQLKTLPDDAKRQEVAKELLSKATRAQDRIQAGLNALDDPHVFEAFRIANQGIATAIRQRACHEKPDASPADQPAPAWRPFQLAFLLMNLNGTAHPTHADRKAVDLLFFPTGGGKTEAYLGLAAFAIVLRRLRDPSIHSSGLTVLMRYTLRLLTLDQLGRAATLICALELERQKDVTKLGEWPFEIGLWVGQSSTPNVMGKKGDNNQYSARSRTIAYLNDSGRKPSPIPLENCPWCGWRFTKDSFKLLPNSDEPTDLRVACISRNCAFYSRKQARGLPVLAVDEPIYRRLPAFIIATVDKFANLPWVGETAGLFGRVQRYDQEGFYGPSTLRSGQPLSKPLPPPDLVIQDELHLISGPLGTMVGLYETAIDALSSPNVGEWPRPKIVASTATVRRAERQIRAIFGRSVVDVFPPPGPDRRDSFFAVTVSAAEKNPRTYVGIAAQGRNLKVVLLRTYLALMAAAQKAWNDNGGSKNLNNPADPYMSLLGYFNSLRELGGSRRIVEDEVKSRLEDYVRSRRRVGETQSMFSNRPRWSEPRELTSRESTNKVADTKRRLALPFQDKDHIDVALATNMISVGLDITRLGLMVVLGQPKTASEYIQATSRVGRDEERPGLVVTLLNVYRPRDRSHYERFCAWHESFYRAVEATSVTPFSPRAIDRGVAAVAVTLARLGHFGMTAPRGAFNINQYRPQLQYVADVISRRAEEHDVELGKDEAEALRKKVKDTVNGLLDAWGLIATTKGDLQYQREVGVAPPLLFDPLDPELARQSRAAQDFKANRSLRDVEPTVNLWLRNPEGVIVEEEDE